MLLLQETMMTNEARVDEVDEANDSDGESMSQRVSRVLLAFSYGSKVQSMREILLPRGIHSMSDLLNSSRSVRLLSELSEFERASFPLQRAVFVGMIYDEETLQCTRYFTCRTSLSSRNRAFDKFDWTAAWCIMHVNLSEWCPEL